MRPPRQIRPEKIMDDDTTISIFPRILAGAKPLPDEPKINQAIQGKIGEQLRTMYDDLKAEPVPDRLLDLIRLLDKPSSSERS